MHELFAAETRLLLPVPVQDGFKPVEQASRDIVRQLFQDPSLPVPVRGCRPRHLWLSTPRLHHRTFLRRASMIC